MKSNFYKIIKEDKIALLQTYLTWNELDIDMNVFDYIDFLIESITIPLLFDFKPSYKPLESRIKEYCDKNNYDYVGFLNRILSTQIKIIFDMDTEMN